MTEEPKRWRGTNTTGTAYKEYTAFLERDPNAPGKWLVRGQNGRIGGNQAQQAKANGLDYAAALKEFDKLVAEKRSPRHGYVDDDASKTADYQSQPQRVDTGVRGMLLTVALDPKPYITNDDWIGQEKINGDRRFIIATAHETRGAQRDGLCVPLPVAIVEATSDLHKSLVLDGEIVGDKYYAFDLLDLEGVDLRRQSFDERYTQLEALFYRKVSAGSVLNLVEAHYTPKDKRELVARVKKQHGEGVVFKHVDAPYVPGLSAFSLKWKITDNADVIVIARNQKKSVQMGVYRDGAPVFVGNVTIGGKQELPPVGAVIEVRYTVMDGSLVEPAYLGIRSDKSPEECTYQQLRLKKRK